TRECSPSITERIATRVVRSATAGVVAAGTAITSLHPKRTIATSSSTSKRSTRGASAPHIARWASGTSRRSAANESSTKRANDGSRTQQLEDGPGLHIERLPSDRASQRRSARYFVQHADPEVGVVRDQHLPDALGYEAVLEPVSVA